MPTMDSHCVQIQAEERVWLPETVNPLELQKNWPELSPEDVLEAFTEPLAMAKSIAPSIDEPVEEIREANFEEAGILQPFLDDVLTPQASVASLALEGNGKCHTETPSLFYAAWQPSLEIPRLDWEYGDVQGVFPEDIGSAFIAASDTPQFLDESFQTFFHFEDSDALQPSPEEPEALPEDRDSLQSK